MISYWEWKITWPLLSLTFLVHASSGLMYHCNRGINWCIEMLLTAQSFPILIQKHLKNWVFWTSSYESLTPCGNFFARWQTSRFACKGQWLSGKIFLLRGHLSFSVFKYFEWNFFSKTNSFSIVYFYFHMPFIMNSQVYRHGGVTP